jgi:serine/threonine-protein kinase
MKAGTHMSHFIEMPKAAAGGVGDLRVRTNPTKANVTVDGKPYGQSPLTVKGLTAGKHRVTLENESGSFTDDVVIEAGATASLVVPMTKPSAGANVSGWIAINAPADLQVFEGGRLVGSSRTDRIMVAVGRHELEMVNEALGYRSTRTVEVAAGQVATVRPEWPKGTLAVNALPWAEVSIDGERVGETPIGSVSVPIGTHDIVFRHPELGERRTTATVTTGAATRVSMDMRAK